MSNFTFAGTDRMPLRSVVLARIDNAQKIFIRREMADPATMPKALMDMLSVKDLVVRYGPVEAVRGIDIAVREGEIVALLGANGAGKSSTLASIAGLVKPASGTITFGGRPIAGLPPETLSRLGIGLVPEGRRVFASLTVAENLWLGGASHGSAADRRQRQREMEERFPILRERTSQKAGLLSGGEQQMLAIARALMSRPKLLLMDEPRSALRADGRARLRSPCGIAQEGHTILLVEQNVPMSLAIADHGFVLANGRIAMAGTGRELAANDKISEAYLAA